jgi:hypothetical protein
MRILPWALIFLCFAGNAHSQSSCENSSILSISDQNLWLQFEELEELDYSGNVVTASTLNWYQLTSNEDINAEFIAMEGIAFNVFSGSCSEPVRYVGAESTLKTASLSRFYPISSALAKHLTPV